MIPRILQVGMTDNPGGVESFIMNVYRNIDRNKIQFDFLVRWDCKPAYEKEIEQMGGRIFKLLYGRKEKLFSRMKDLEEFYIEHPEIIGIHYNTCSLTDCGCLKTNKNLSFRICHSHNSGFMEKRTFYQKFFIDSNIRVLKRKSVDLLACSKKAGKWMFGDIPFKVIPNAIDVEKFTYNPSVRETKWKKLKLEKEKFVIGVVGRIQYQKNPEFILDIFSQIYQKEPNAVLLWIGDGDLKNVIQKKINELNLQDVVQLLGIRSDIHELYQVMDVFLLPSRFEGLPIVGIEAQAAGLPCFMADTITNEVDLTGLVQFISLKNTPADWAEKILNYKNNDTRKNTNEMIKKAGYDIKDTAEKMENYYLSFLKKE
ncbi:glycosyltransferase family 1 protein [Eubacterium limosum]|uniref:Glycosyltransferase family 1 protein n=1 Tax=Eubacterium limosum TaxID=1736 RepID=A0ABT5UQ06_EUBLI|nr:glycosyltransferase family 1 protein [Eubacterium limosum]MCB6568168.1 glycosyltransferase family 1 protein [Eubacterium limosum]MDE1470045.1 glycosyltransferase family 1 protein [Eubacterium limosum]